MSGAKIVLLLTLIHFVVSLIGKLFNVRIVKFKNDSDRDSFSDSQ